MHWTIKQKIVRKTSTSERYNIKIDVNGSNAFLKLVTASACSRRCFKNSLRLIQKSINVVLLNFRLRLGLLGLNIVSSLFCLTSAD